MAANVRTEMRIPTRAAPRPPGHSVTQREPIWGSSNDIFGSALTATQPVQKKKPPPRPPPPKFNLNHTQCQRDQKSRKPARPTELLTNFFGRKKQEISLPPRSGQLQNQVLQPANTTATVSLIDLSPPGSPTFTTRSSSDGVSVDSFGSDGNSNPSVFMSSGNTSESAFEDDFDFFGLSAKKTAQNDPWQAKTMAPNPFGLLENTCSNVSQSAGDTCLFSLSSNVNRVANQVPSIQTISKPPVTSMPTIIRARPPKPPAPKILSKKFEPTIKEACTDYKLPNNGTANQPLTLGFTISDSSTTNKPLTLDFSNAWSNNDGDDSPSPPMPTIPPPAPPVNYLAELNGDHRGNFDKPYGIALYDFSATHPDDLPLKEGDFVQLLKKINDDWLEGRIGNRQGMFPFNFVDIKVPLPGLRDNIVTALYTFHGESSDDLSFEEGAKIAVISRISEDWLYGEYNGRKGQFPVNHVNRLPCNIPYQNPA